MDLSHYSTQQVVYTTGGKVVGEIAGDTLVKRVRGSVHQLRQPPGWAVDLAILETARASRVSRVEIRDTETGARYLARLDDFFNYGVRFNRGFGEQVCLPLSRWQTRREGQPEQLTMAFEA